MVLRFVDLRLLLWHCQGHGCLCDWPDRLLSWLLLLDRSLVDVFGRIIDSFRTVSALVSLDLDDLLLYLVEAHQLVELVCDLVEHFQLVFEQTGLFQVADEVHRRWNDVLVALSWGSPSVNFALRSLEGTVFHQLPASHLVLLVALGGSGSPSGLVQCRLRSGIVLDLLLVLLVELFFDLGVGLSQLLDQLGHVADAFQRILEVLFNVFCALLFLIRNRVVGLLIELVK